MTETLEGRLLFATGDLDTTFGGDGIAAAGPATTLNTALAVAVQADGKVILAGEAEAQSFAGSSSNMLVSRLNADGTPDTTFGNAGNVGIDVGLFDTAEDVLLQPDGKILVGGWTRNSQTSNDYEWVLARLNADGTPDTTFGTAGRVITSFGTSEDRIRAIALQNDGKIVAVGIGTAAGNQLGVARYNPNGTLDTGFGTGGKLAMNVWGNISQGHDVVILPGDKILIAAEGPSNGPNGGHVTVGLVRLNPNGAADLSFGTGFQGPGTVVDDVGTTLPTALAVDTAGNIYVAGTVHDDADVRTTQVFKYGPTGTKMTSFGTGGEVSVATGGFLSYPVGLTLQPDGKLLVAATTAAGGQTDGAWTLARLTPEGAFDPTFGTGGKVTTAGGSRATAHDVTLAPGNKIVVAGYSNLDMMAARYLSDAGGTPTAGSISGVVYRDDDADGVRDAGEPGLSGWRVYQDLNNNGVYDTGPRTIASTDVPKPIPDTQPGVATSNLVVANVGTVTDVDVTLNIDHTYVADLMVTLISPAGTRVQLFRNIGSGGDNFRNTTLDDEASQSIAAASAPFTGRFRPMSPATLSAFDGQNADGTWRLEVVDEFQPDQGVIQGWSLSLSGSAEPSATTAADGTYTFANVAPGTYTIREVVQTGYTQTAPAGGAHTVLVGSGQAVTGIDFGNFLGTIPATVVGRRVFYNDSAFDGDNVAINTADNNAIATDKQALRPGQTATFSNVTSYSKGITGVMVDIQHLGQGVTASDLQFRYGNTSDPSLWAAAPAPLQFNVRPGGGENGSSRVTVVWAQNVIRNTWLRVTVLANARTGLTSPDVFYFGNLAGETGDNALFAVTARDVVNTRANLFAENVPVTNRYDFNRDGRVSVMDYAIVRRNFARSIRVLSAPGAAAITQASAEGFETLRPSRVWNDGSDDLLA